MFDFPTSPTVDQVSNGYKWNGYAWVGGAGGGGAVVSVSDTAPASPTDNQLWYESDTHGLYIRYNDGSSAQWLQVNATPGAGPIREQWFDLGGKALQDITIPDWATGVELIGAVYGSVAAVVQLRVSFDGTTFPFGASDYQNVGGLHAGGSGGYINNALASGNAISLTLSSDSVSFPHAFDTQMNLVRPTAPGSFFHCKTHSHTYDSNAANLYRQQWWSGNPMPALSTALAIKALRLFPSAGTFAAGSHVQVRWLGDSASVPVSNAIADAPSDGTGYERVNGVWRRTSQVLDVSGQSQNDVVVPTGARRVRWEGSYYAANATSQYMGLRVSFDGSTFLAGATDYTYAGWAHHTNVAPTAITNYPASGQNHIFLALAGNETTVQHVIEGALTLSRPTASGLLAGRTRGLCYQTTNGYEDAQTNCWVSTVGSNLAIKALRFYNIAGVNWASGTINLNWMY